MKKIILIIGLLFTVSAQAGYTQVCVNNECQWVWTPDQ